MKSPAASSAHNPPTHAEDQVDVKISDILGILRLFAYGTNVWPILAASVALVVVSSSAFMVSARLIGSFVEALVSSSGQPQRLTWIAIGVVTLEVIGVTGQYFGRLSVLHSTNEILFKVRSELFAKLRMLPIRYYDRQPLGRIITRLTSDVDGIEAFFGGTLARVLTALVNVVTVSVIMLVTNVPFAFLVIASNIPTIVFRVVTRGPQRHWLRTHKRRAAHLNSRLAEFLNGLPVIKTFGIEDWSLAVFQESGRDHLNAGLKIMKWNSILQPLTAFFSVLPTALILYWGGTHVLERSLSLGIVVAFIRFNERFSQPIRSIAQEIQIIQEALTSSERVRNMLEEPEESVDLGADGLHTGAVVGTVRYDNVGMHYDTGRPVLDGITFEVRRGMKIGLVGETGSGKTTTVNLLPRLYPYQSGRVFLDDLPLENWNRRTLREQIGMVSQEVIVFRGTLRANLIAAIPHTRTLSDADIAEACRRTGLMEIVERFPGGFDGLVLEGGENLSMGERQLIALTRMLIRDPALLILDEATANIDEHCERLIQRAITEVMHRRTCFIIAHRLSTILQCDEILVFDKGRIVERGSHDQLMAVNGFYAALALKQAPAVGRG